MRVIPALLVAVLLGGGAVILASSAYAADATADRYYVDGVLDGLVRQGILTQAAADAIKANAAAYAAEKAGQSAAKPKEPVAAGFGKIQFDGLSQNWFVFDSSSDAMGKEINTFRLRRMELKFSGRISPVVDWTVMLDPTKQLALNVSSAGGVVTGVSPKQSTTVLQDVFINYKFGPDQSLRIGQYKLPLSYEGLASSAKLDTVERALVFSRGKLGDVRDIGVEWDGSFARGTWQLGLFNGQGESQSTTDNNQEKCMAGRLTWRATDTLSVGASGLVGVSESPTPGGDANRLGFEAIYRQGANQIRGEYMQGEDGVNSRHGWYLLGTHDFSPEWQMVARYDVFDPDRSIAGDRQTDYLIGCTRFLTSHNAKLQLNFIHNQRQSGATSGDQMLFNAQVAF